MQRVFSGSNSVEAHIISHLLEQAGILTNISGEYLSAARGELPAMDQGAVWVLDDDDADRACALIVTWEQ